MAKGVGSCPVIIEGTFLRELRELVEEDGGLKALGTCKGCLSELLFMLKLNSFEFFFLGFWGFGVLGFWWLEWSRGGKSLVAGSAEIG